MRNKVRCGKRWPPKEPDDATKMTEPEYRKERVLITRIITSNYTNNDCLTTKRVVSGLRGRGLVKSKLITWHLFLVLRTPLKLFFFSSSFFVFLILLSLFSFLHSFIFFFYVLPCSSKFNKRNFEVIIINRVEN